MTKFNCFTNRYPLEMHMVHIEDRYINAEGTYDLHGALADPNGLAVLGIFFDADPKKPQVNQQNTISYVIKFN